MSEFLQADLRVAAITISCVGALTLSACSGPEMTQAHPAPITIVQPNLQTLPKDPCHLDPKAKATLRETETCINAYQDTQIALVTYDIPTDVATGYAQDAAGQLSKATNNLLHPDIHIIPISDAAKKATAADLSKNDKNLPCIDINNSSTYVSVHADIAMPELAESDLVVGLSDIPTCDGGENGVADAIGGRHIEVFTTPAYNAPSGSDVIVNAIEHEILHGFGLDHDGEVDTGRTNSFFPAGQESPTVQDVMSRLERNYTYKEYGTEAFPFPDPMGSFVDRAYNVQLNPVHQNELLWPMIAKGTTSPREHPLQYNKPQSIPIDEANAGVFNTLTFPSPITLYRGFTDQDGHREDPNHYRVFNQVAIVPITGVNKDVTPPDPFMVGTEFYLVGDGNLTAQMDNPGLVKYGEDPKTWLLQFGDKLLKLNVSNKGMVATLTGK